MERETTSLHTWLSLLRNVAFSIIFKHFKSSIRLCRKFSYLASCVRQWNTFYTILKKNASNRQSFSYTTDIWFKMDEYKIHPVPRNVAIVHKFIVTKGLNAFHWNKIKTVSYHLIAHLCKPWAVGPNQWYGHKHLNGQIIIH